jgi:hypothetical protein
MVIPQQISAAEEPEYILSNDDTDIEVMKVNSFLESDG